MVRGLDIFRQWFAEFADQYVLIGGTAASLTMEEAGRQFRATKDLDIVLHVEALTPVFGAAFCKVMGAGGYQIRQSSTGKPIFSAGALKFGLLAEEVAGEVVLRAIELARHIAAGTLARPVIERGPVKQVPAELQAVEIGHRSKVVDAILVRAILQGCRLSLAEGLALEARCFGEVCGTQDMRLGVENFQKNGPRSKAAFIHA